MKEKDDDNLKSAISNLKDEYHADVHIICSETDDGKKVMKGIFFFTKEMCDAFKAWPEVVFVDGKYNTLKNKMTVVLMCVQDSNGFTHIISVVLVTLEDKETLRIVFSCLKRVDEDACSRIRSFMCDNDLTERNIVKEVYPDVNLLLCELHILKIFSKKFTTSGMGITVDERHLCLELLNKMVKSNSEEQYDDLYIKFCELAPDTVRKYFDKYYHPSRKEWVRYYMSNGNYGNYTNNPVESQNARLSKLCHHATMKTFFREFFSYQKRKNEAIKHHLGDELYKRPMKGYLPDTVLYLYQSNLTAQAFKKVLIQYEMRKSLTFFEINEEKQICWIKSGYTMLKTTLQTCECQDFKCFELPCRHITYLPLEIILTYHFLT